MLYQRTDIHGRINQIHGFQQNTLSVHYNTKETGNSQRQLRSDDIRPLYQKSLRSHIGTQHVQSTRHNAKSKVYNIDIFYFLSVWHVDALRKLLKKDTPYLACSFLANAGVDRLQSSTLTVTAWLALINA